MKRKRARISKGETFWSFALINGRLADIYFEKGKGLEGISGHGYINKEWLPFATTYEKKLIKFDTKKYNLVYRNGKYRDKNKPSSKKI